jgi:hypothetical protein
MKKLISIVLLAVLCSMTVVAQPKPKLKCNGTTIKGDLCKSTILVDGLYCRVHSDKTPRCGAKTSKSTNCRMKVKTEGLKCSHHSKQ